ncbi:hypothetical protein ACFVXG_27445 [Kitasatospora sp. NPDC058162]|uniref:hypothetical protein n=1 Tax=Kitasatospora sp. NPDC058162 TaxID=3346362 RepID=UPI0036DA7805
MTDHAFPRRTDRPWLIALFAAATWVQPWFLIDTSATWWAATLWFLLLALTVLPQAVTDPLWFRRTCRIVAGVVLGTEIAVSAPNLLPLPFLLVLFPAGLLLLLAGWGRGSPVRGFLAALLLAVPFLLGFATLCRPR